MRVIIAENYEKASAIAADIIEAIVRENPECTLGLATGSSPVGMYRELLPRIGPGLRPGKQYRQQKQSKRKTDPFPELHIAALPLRII